MKLNNGCLTTNGGQVETLKIRDVFLKTSLLQIERITHNPSYKMIAYYYPQKTAKGIVKVCIVVHKNKKTNIEGATVFRYKSLDSLQHYWSRNYESFIGMPSMQYTIVKYIHSYL